jgi:hypothetical protein
MPVPSGAKLFVECLEALGRSEESQKREPTLVEIIGINDLKERIPDRCFQIQTNCNPD